MEINKELRGIIYSKFKNMTEFAKALEWSYQRLSKALKNPGRQPLENIVKMIEVLDLEIDERSIRFFMPI